MGRSIPSLLGVELRLYKGRVQMPRPGLKPGRYKGKSKFKGRLGDGDFFV